MQKILIVDDNEKICLILKEGIEKAGYAPIVANSGLEALEIFSKEPMIQLVLLDVMMDGIDGLELCQHIRRNSKVPIIMISAKGEEEDRIQGLDLGADDYISKPFGVKEVIARIRALLRRTLGEEHNVINCRDLQIDVEKHSTYVAGQPVVLTKKEEMLLALLAKSPGKVFTRDTLMELAWNYDSESSDRAVDTHIKRLRAKLDAHEHPGFAIKTIWGRGYQLEVYERGTIE